MLLRRRKGDTPCRVCLRAKTIRRQCELCKRVNQRGRYAFSAQRQNAPFDVACGCGCGVGSDAGFAHRFDQAPAVPRPPGAAVARHVHFDHAQMAQQRQRFTRVILVCVGDVLKAQRRKRLDAKRANLRGRNHALADVQCLGADGGRDLARDARGGFRRQGVGSVQRRAQDRRLQPRHIKRDSALVMLDHRIRAIHIMVHALLGILKAGQTFDFSGSGHGA